jgi:hypothetical protein
MDAWLGPGFVPSAIERRSILSRLSNCSIISSSADGALHSRTALIEYVAQSGGSLTVRLMGSGMYDDIIPNPRIVLTARPALGPHDLVVVNGLARIQSHMATGGERELLPGRGCPADGCWGSAATSPRQPPIVEDREQLPATRSHGTETGMTSTA